MDPRLRQQVIDEWRGVFTRRPKPGAPKAAAELVPTVIARLGLSERLTEAQVTAAWRAIVGEFLANHSRPARLTNGVLTIQVLQPAVRYELEINWKRQIVDRLQRRFGRQIIREVRFGVS